MCPSLLHPRLALSVCSATRAARHTYSRITFDTQQVRGVASDGKRKVPLRAGLTRTLHEPSELRRVLSGCRRRTPPSRSCHPPHPETGRSELCLSSTVSFPHRASSKSSSEGRSHSSHLNFVLQESVLGPAVCQHRTKRRMRMPASQPKRSPRSCTRGARRLTESRSASPTALAVSAEILGERSRACQGVEQRVERDDER